MTAVVEQGGEVPGYTVPLHRALSEPILLGGAPRALAILNGTLAGAIGLGLRLWLVGLAIWAVGHVAAVWAAKRDRLFVDVVRRQIFFREGMQFGHDFHAGYVFRQLGNQRGQIAAAAAYFQYAVSGFEPQCLQSTCFQFWFPHRNTVTQRNFNIHECLFPICGRHELLALDLAQQVQNPSIQYIPRPYLLLNHIKACLFHFLHLPDS